MMKILKNMLIYGENKEKFKFKFGDIKYWDTTNITIMKQLFYDTNNFNEDLSHWNVSNVKDMTEMFYGSSFNGISEVTSTHEPK